MRIGRRCRKRWWKSWLLMKPLSVERVDSAAEAEQMVKDKKVAGSVVVPNGYQKSFVEGNKAEVVFQHGPELAIATGIKQLLDDAMAQTAVRMQAAKTWSAKTGQGWQDAYEKLTSSAAVAGGGSGSVGVESQMVVKGKESSRMNNSAERAVGFSIMFVMMSLLSVTGTILEARKIGVWYRMMAAPATRMQILGGYMLAFFVTGWLQFGILMGLSSVLFDVEWGNWIGEIVLVSAFLLCVVGLDVYRGLGEDDGAAVGAWQYGYCGDLYARWGVLAAGYCRGYDEEDSGVCAAEVGDGWVYGVDSERWGSGGCSWGGSCFVGVCGGVYGGGSDEGAV